MGNSFGPNGFSIGSSLTRFIVEIPQVVLHEGDEPDVLTDLRDAHALTGEDMTEVHLAAAEADATAAGHHDGLIVEGIGQVLKATIDTR